MEIKLEVHKNKMLFRTKIKLIEWVIMAKLIILQIKLLIIIIQL